MRKSTLRKNTLRKLRTSSQTTKKSGTDKASESYVTESLETDPDIEDSEKQQDDASVQSIDTTSLLSSEHKCCHLGDIRQQDPEIIFKELIKKLRTQPAYNLLKDKSVIIAIDFTIKKDYEDNMPFTAEALQECTHKLNEITMLAETRLEKRLAVKDNELSAAVRDFEATERIKNEIENFKQNAAAALEKREKMQVWLQKAIEQNVGIMELGGVKVTYDEKSLGLFHYQNRCRLAVAWVTEGTVFNVLIVSLILLGSLCMAAYDYEDPEEKTLYNKTLSQILDITSIVFTLEAVAKIITMGFYKHKNAYLRDGWNILDFLVVIASWVDIVAAAAGSESVAQVKVFRVIRVIRPLRTVKRVPTMRRLVAIMLRSLPELANTLAFMFFFFIVFAIIGIQNFHGDIYNRCRLTPAPVNGQWQLDPTQSHFICAKANNQTLEQDMKTQRNLCKGQSYCGSPLDYPSLDPLLDNPWRDPLIDYNTVNFNNLWTATTLVFEALTLEGWSKQMQRLNEAGSSYLAIPFFLLLIAFGSYFILNLILAVIMGSFSKYENKELRERLESAEQAELARLGDMNEGEDSEIDDGSSSVMKEPHSGRQGVEDDGNVSNLSVILVKSKTAPNGQVTPFNGIVQNDPADSSSAEKQAATSQGVNTLVDHAQMVGADAASNDVSLDYMNRFNESSMEHGLLARQGNNTTLKDNFGEPDRDLLPIPRSNRSRSRADAGEVRQRQTSSLLPQIRHGNQSLQQQAAMAVSEEAGFELPPLRPPRLTVTCLDGVPDSRVLKQNDSASPSYTSPGRKRNLNESDDQLEGGSPKISNKRSSNEVAGSAGDHSPGLSSAKEDSEQITEESQENDTFDQCCNFKTPAWWNRSAKCYSKTTIYKFFSWICQSQLFNYIVLLAIAVNTGSLSMDRYPIEDEQAKTLEQINYTTTWIFVGEMIIKLIGQGVATYVSTSMNQFDALVVIISMVELALQGNQVGSEAADTSNEGTTALTLFRGFRLLRVFRLARNWHSFHSMMVKITQTVKDILSFFVLVLVVVLVFSLLGVELFSNYVKLDKDNEVVEKGTVGAQSPRLNFDNPRNGIVSVFACLIGDDWQLIMHDMIRAKQDQFLPRAYFLLVMVIGNLFIMNLFLAILLKNFEDKHHEVEHSDSHKRFEQNTEKLMLLKEDSSTKKLEAKECGDCKEQTDDVKFGESLKLNMRRVHMKNEEEQRKQEGEAWAGALEEFASEREEEENSKSHEVPDEFKLSQNTSSNRIDSPASGGLDSARGAAIGARFLQKLSNKQRKLKTSKILEVKPDVELEGSSLCCFDAESTCRIFLGKVVTSGPFEAFIFIIVVLSSVLMTFDTPLSDPSSLSSHIMDIVNDVITGIFIVEVVLKTIVYGLVCNGPNSYLRGGWNILDFIIVVTSTASFFIDNFAAAGSEQSALVGNLELLKMLRVLRSMRLFSRIEGLKLCVLSLIYSMPGIFNVAVVSLLMFCLFGIFFLNIFKGRFAHCKLPEPLSSLVDIDTQIITKYDCINLGGRWVNKDINFDSMSNSILSLFIISTCEGWLDFMLQATDAVDIGMEPKRDQNPAYQYLIIFYMIFGSLFITNLFIEVVINTFYREKATIDKDFTLTAFQKEWIEAQLKCYEAKPRSRVVTQNNLRLICLRIVDNYYFEYFIMMVITFNALALVCVWPGIDPQIVSVSETMQNVFTWIFLIEFVLKIVAYQRIYFHSGWNVFDFVVAVAGAVGVIFGSEVTQNLSVFRILRVGRVLRLLKKAKRLYTIFNSFLRTIPAFANVGTLILVMIFIFSSLGMRLFAAVKLHETADTYMNNQINFQTFPQAFLTLIVAMTGEGWFLMMFELGAQNSIDHECKERPTYADYVAADYRTVGCGYGLATSTAFFVSYIFLVSIVLVNLFIAVTLAGFEEVQREDSCRITEISIEHFIEVWSEHDPDGTGYIHISNAQSLMRDLIEKKADLFPPKAQDLFYNQSMMADFVEHLQLKLYKKFQYYNFNDVLIAVSQFMLRYLAARPQEIDEIIGECREIHGKVNADGDAIEDVDDVILIIEEIQKRNDVNMCKQLDEALQRFKNEVVTEIDHIDGNVYDSSMIPLVVKIQKLFRRRRQARLEQIEMQKALTARNFQRRACIGEEQMESCSNHISTKQILENDLFGGRRRAAKTTLDNLLAEVEQGLHVPPDIPHIQVINSTESLMPAELIAERRAERGSGTEGSVKSKGKTASRLTATDLSSNLARFETAVLKGRTTSAGDSSPVNSSRRIKTQAKPKTTQIVQLENFKPLKAWQIKEALTTFLRNQKSEQTSDQRSRAMSVPQVSPLGNTSGMVERFNSLPHQRKNGIKATEQSPVRETNSSEFSSDSAKRANKDKKLKKRYNVEDLRVPDQTVKRLSTVAVERACVNPASPALSSPNFGYLSRQQNLNAQPQRAEDSQAEAHEVRGASDTYSIFVKSQADSGRVRERQEPPPDLSASGSFADAFERATAAALGLPSMTGGQGGFFDESEYNNTPDKAHRGLRRQIDRDQPALRQRLHEDQLQIATNMNIIEEQFDSARSRVVSSEEDQARMTGGFTMNQSRQPSSRRQGQKHEVRSRSAVSRAVLDMNYHETRLNFVAQGRFPHQNVEMVNERPDDATESSNDISAGVQNLQPLVRMETGGRDRDEEEEKHHDLNLQDRRQSLGVWSASQGGEPLRSHDLLHLTQGDAQADLAYQQRRGMDAHKRQTKPKRP